MKGIIFALQSKTMLWQLNEVWPTGGWGSLEYGAANTAGQLIGGRWKPTILFHLKDRPRRFNELRRLMPDISQRMLTLQLRALEADGIVGGLRERMRQRICAVPVGRTLLHRLQTLRGCEWPAGQTGALQGSEVQFRTGMTGSSTRSAIQLQILAVKLALPSGLPLLRGRSAQGPAGWGMRAAP